MIPYRTRRVFRKLSITLLVLLLSVAALLLCWLLWLNRYVVYTRDGAVLDFYLSLEFPEGQVAESLPPAETVPIYFNEAEDVAPPESTELTQLSGICISGETLAQSFSAVEEQLKALPAEAAIMLDVKNIRGEFYYPTALGPNSDSIDPAKMADLVSWLRQSGHYLIARLPALRDYHFGLENVDCGIFNPNRLSLWIDEENCYWLNPTSDGTLNYLVQIVTELKDMGFDEVLFYDFCLPNTDAIYFENDPVAAINNTADSLVKICATDTFALSFANSSSSFHLPEGRSRLYLQNVAAADIAATVQNLGLADPQIRLVFLTDLKDTRYDEYGVLRPLDIQE